MLASDQANQLQCDSGWIAIRASKPLPTPRTWSLAWSLHVISASGTQNNILQRNREIPSTGIPSPTLLGWTNGLVRRGSLSGSLSGKVNNWKKLLLLTKASRIL